MGSYILTTHFFTIYFQFYSSLETANLKVKIDGNTTSVRFATLKQSGIGNIRFIYEDGSYHALEITEIGLEYKYIDANGSEKMIWAK